MRKSALFILLGTITVGFLGQQAMSGPPDTAICDGLTGAAWGLCRGGAAAGCADGTGNESACANIEETFVKSTGLPAPWLVPPASCPCDFESVPKTVPPWGVFVSTGIQFACTTSDNTAALLSDPATGTLNGANIGVIDYLDPPACIINIVDPWVRIQVSPLSPEEILACRQDVIDYAKEFMTLNPTVLIDDTCSPNL